MSRNKLEPKLRVRVHLEWIQGTHEDLIKDEIADILGYIESLEREVEAQEKIIKQLQQGARRHE